MSAGVAGGAGEGEGAAGAGAEGAAGAGGAAGGAGEGTGQAGSAGDGIGGAGSGEEGAQGGEGGTGEGLSGGEGGAAGEGEGTGGEGEGAGENAYVGIPEGGYADLTIPEGFTADEGMMNIAKYGATALGLNQDGYQALADLHVKSMEHLNAQVQEQHNEIVSDWKSQWEKDSEFGGDKREESQALIKKTVEVMLKDDPYDTLARLVSSGQEFDPGLMRLFAKVGQLLVDDSFTGGGAGDHKRNEGSLAERMYPGLK